MAITVGQDNSKTNANYYYIAKGATDSETVINKAINDTTDGVVNFEVGIYHISSPIYVYRDDITLKGVSSRADETSGTTIYGFYYTCPEDMMGKVEPKGSRTKTSKSGYIWAWGVNNFKVSDLNFHSDCLGHERKDLPKNVHPLTKPGHAGGPDARNCIVMTACNNCEIYCCRTSPYIYMDFVNSKGGKNNKIHDNVLWVGHAGIQTIREDGTEAYNNEIHIMNNAGLRIYYGDNIDFHNNLICGWQGGQAAMECQGEHKNCKLTYNIIQDAPNLVVVQRQDIVVNDHGQIRHIPPSGTFLVSHNVFWNKDNKPGTIQFGDNDGTNLEITDSSKKNVQYWIKQGYGPQNNKLSDPEPEVYSTMEESYGTAQMT